MNVVEIIPQLFFDLIARAVPGSVFLGLIMYGNRDSWQTAVERLWPTAALSPVYGLAVFIGVAYVIGHILAAPAQLFDGFIDRRAQKFIDRELGKDAKKIDECWGNLDWLRVHQPDLAIIPTKIFAEYTMYSGLAVAFLLATMGTLIGILQFTTRDWLSILASLVVLVLLVVACVYLGVRQRASLAMLIQGLKYQRSQVEAGEHAQK